MEKRNYVVYCNLDGEDIERVILMTEEKAKAIEWFINAFDLDGSVVPANDYMGEEI